MLPGSEVVSGPDALNSFALTIKVSDGKLVAVYSTQYVCNGLTQTDIDTIPLSGVVGDDGSFSLAQTAQNGPPTHPAVEKSGKTPSSAGSQWAGNYRFVLDPSVRAQPFTGTFNPTKIEPVTGMYSAATRASRISEPISITANFTQGATIPATGSAPSIFDATAITGGVTVSGASCLSSGTLNSTKDLLFSTFVGNFVELTFAMNDGSKLVAVGYEQDVTAKTIEIEGMVDFPSNCHFQAMVPSTLSR
jgi:hypothetical protein